VDPLVAGWRALGEHCQLRRDFHRPGGFPGGIAAGCSRCSGHKSKQGRRACVPAVENGASLSPDGSAPAGCGDIWTAPVRSSGNALGGIGSAKVADAHGGAKNARKLLAVRKIWFYSRELLQLLTSAASNTTITLATSLLEKGCLNGCRMHVCEMRLSLSR
jgi:hypothetical protein